MIRTYIRLAVRSLIKNKVFSFINVFGLAIGLTSCLLITLFIQQELSYDKHQKLGNRLYQLGSVSILEGRQDRHATTAAPLASTMQAEFPEIESTTRLMKAFQEDKTLIQYREGKELKSFYEPKGYFADSNFFQLFTYRFKEGNPATALMEPNTVALSEDIARKLFGREPALNKMIHINSSTSGSFDFRVTGVYVEPAGPSHIDARFIMSMQSGEVGPWVRSITNMTNNNLFYSYLLLKPGADPRALEGKFDAFVTKYMRQDLKASGRDRKQFLVAVPDIHLYAKSELNVTEGGNINYLYILVSIAVVILLIACVNFMNLSTARSSHRAVEIGVRKVLGAERKSLIRQFLWEAILLSVFSYLVSIIFAFLLLPLFEKVTGKEYHFSTSGSALLILAFFLIAILAGLIAGLYPAFYLSLFKPVRVLKGKFANSFAAISFRKVLVVFQFVISVALIVASITISNQMRYMRSKDLGFQKEQQVVIPLRTSTAKANYPALKDELLRSTAVTNAGASMYYPGIANVSDWLLYKQGNQPDQTRQVYMNQVDYSYLQTLDVKLVAGRLFSRDFPADTSQRMIVNEQAIREFEFASPGDAIGKNLVAKWGPEEVSFQIVGVVKDFHFKDLHASIESYGFLLNPGSSHSYLVAHTKGADMKRNLETIGSAWSKLNPDEPFEYSFLDQDFARNYAAEERLGSIIRYFTIIAIFISCLGLFGLTTFTVEQRVKEIGIRKVLGASTPGLVTLLSKDFMKLVVISFLLASPTAWYFVQKWLENFAYKVPFTIWILVAGWSAALLIAFLTISIQAIKAALANPVTNLRSE